MRHPQHAPARGGDARSASTTAPWMGTIFGLVASLIFVSLELEAGGVRIRLFDVSLALFVAWMLIFHFRGNRLPSTRSITPLVLFGMFMIYVTLSAAAFAGPAATIKTTIQTIEFFLFAYLLSNVLADDAARWRFVVAFTIGLWVTGIANLGLHMAMGSYFSFKEFGDMKLTYGLGAMFTLFLLLTRIRPAVFLRLLLLLVVMLVLLLLSSERKSWIAFGVAVTVSVPLVLMLSSAATRQLRTAIGRLAFVGPLIVVLIAILVFTVPEINRRAVQTIGAYVVLMDGDSAAIDEAYQSASNNARAFVTELALEVYLENPVFGIGSEGFKNLTNSLMWEIPESFRTAAHNEFLTVAAETGSIGLGLYVLIWISTLAKSFRIGLFRRSTEIPTLDRLIVIGGAVYAVTICAFLSTSATTMFFLTFPIGYVAALDHRFGSVRRRARSTHPALAHAART